MHGRGLIRNERLIAVLAAAAVAGAVSGLNAPSARAGQPAATAVQRQAATAAAMATPTGERPLATAHHPDLEGISCHSAGDCLAVGYYVTGPPVTEIPTPVAKTWNGTRWRAVRVTLPRGASGSYLYGVACPARTFCVAVGDSVYRHTGQTEVWKALADVWNGTAWKPVRPPAGPDSMFQAVTCRSANSCVAVGEGSTVGGIGGLLADSWNGRTWTAGKVPPPKPGKGGFLDGVSCATASFCAAGGAVFPGHNGPETPLLERWNGKKWAATMPPTPAPRADTAVDAVSCPTADSCVAVGAGITHGPLGSVSYADAWNGSKWALTSAVPWPNGTTDPWLYGVSCRAAGRCVAVGLTGWDPASNGKLSGHAAAASWNGKSWTPSKVTVPGQHTVSAFQGVACLPGTRVFCAAAGEWAPVEFGLTSALSGLWLGRQWRVTAFGR